MNVRIHELCFQYPRQGFGLRVARLELPRGAHAAFVGPSGSGKSTLLRLLAGILLPDAGELRVGDAELPRLSEAARRTFRIRRVGFVFQDFKLIEHLSVRENIRLPYRLHHALTWNKATGQRLGELAGALGIGEKLDAPVTALSHGEMQRVATCRALLPRPSLLLADEPTGNLDPASKRASLELLREQARQGGATLILVTHDHDLLAGFDPVIDFATFHGTAT